jgi:hypothetical protein
MFKVPGQGRSQPGSLLPGIVLKAFKPKYEELYNLQL